MRAIVWTQYGPPDVLRLRAVAKPTPKDHEALIKVFATTVTAGDCELRGLKVPPAFQIPIRLYMGPFKPRKAILGQELAGEIEAVGRDVTKFKPGDQVYGWTAFRLGGYAEYACLPESSVLALKPPNLSYEEAAVLPVGGLEAVYFVSRGNVQRGQKVLIIGAGGSIGSFAVQLAKRLGADVTAVDTAEKMDFLRSIGADQVLDYTRENFTQRGATYDVIIDVIGKSPFSGSLRSLTPSGRYLIDNPTLSQRLRANWASARSSKKVIPWASRPVSESLKDLTFLTGRIAAGEIKPIINKRYPLERIAEAHRYADAGHKKGNIVITVAQTS